MVGNRGGIAIGSNPLVHSPIPIFADDDDEHRCQRPANIVEVVSRKRVKGTRGIKFPYRLFADNQIVITVYESNVRKEFHAEKRKNVHEKDEKQTKVTYVLKTLGCLLENFRKLGPNFSELEQA